MLNRKLLELIQRFSPAEHRRLRLFLQSPYFNNSRQAGQLLELYDYIEQYDALEEHPSLQKESVAVKFFPAQPYREKEKGPLDSLTSQLLQLIREFLVQQYFEKEQTVADEAVPMLRFYRKFGLEDRFWQTVQAARKDQEALQLRDAKYFLGQFRIEEEVSTFQGTSNTYEDDANISEVNKYLDGFYSIIKLEYACAFYHQHRSSQIDVTTAPKLTQAVIELAGQENAPDIPLVHIYMKILNILSGSYQRQDLVELEEMLAANKTTIPEDKFKDLQTFYRTFWGREYMQSGGQDYKQKIFDIFEKHLADGYFYFDNKIAPLSYRSLLSVGLKLGKFEWVKKLLDEHPPEQICGTRYPNEVYNLNLAEYHFYKKEYEESIQNLTYRPFENPNFSILAEVLLIKIYFETENDLLDSRMKALDQKVRRTMLSREAKEYYFNFLKKLDKIIKYGWQKNSPKRIKLFEEIKSQPNICAREWLLERFSEKPVNTMPNT